MTTEFLARARHEISLSLVAIRETVFAIAERVNRSVQTLKLHWRASTIADQTETIHHQLGTALTNLLAGETEAPPHAVEATTRAAAAQPLLADAAARTRLLKRDLVHVESLIRELEIEALRDDLLKIQHDLSARGLSLRRITVIAQTAADGRPVQDLPLEPPIRFVALLRGPTLVPSPESVVLRPGDVVLLLGPSTALHQTVAHFFEQDRVPA
jgi:hypothetical protein